MWKSLVNNKKLCIILTFIAISIFLITCNDSTDDVDDNDIPEPTDTICPNNFYYELIDSVLPAPQEVFPGVVADHYNFACAPNIFSPNGDHINDNFYIVFADSIPHVKIQIYSETDQLLYELTGSDFDGHTTPGWNGSDTTGIMCPAGKYRVTARFPGPEGEVNDCFNIWIISSHEDYLEFFNSEKSAFPDQIHSLFGKVFPTSEPLSISK